MLRQTHISWQNKSNIYLLLTNFVSDTDKQLFI